MSKKRWKDRYNNLEFREGKASSLKNSTQPEVGVLDSNKISTLSEKIPLNGPPDTRVAGSSDYGLYYDSNGYLTAGIGHLIKGHEDPHDFKYLTEAEARDLLKKDTESHDKDILDVLKQKGIDSSKLEKYQLDAMKDFGYQLGKKKALGFTNSFSKLKKALDSGEKEDFKAAVKEFGHSDWARNHKKSRYADFKERMMEPFTSHDEYNKKLEEDFIKGLETPTNSEHLKSMDEKAKHTQDEMLKKIADLRREYDSLSSPNTQRMLKEIPSEYIDRRQIEDDLESSYVQRPEERFYESQSDPLEFNKGGIVKKYADGGKVDNLKQNLKDLADILGIKDEASKASDMSRMATKSELDDLVKLKDIQKENPFHTYGTSSQELKRRNLDELSELVGGDRRSAERPFSKKLQEEMMPASTKARPKYHPFIENPESKRFQTPEKLMQTQMPTRASVRNIQTKKAAESAEDFMRPLGTVVDDVAESTSKIKRPLGALAKETAEEVSDFIRPRGVMKKLPGLAGVLAGGVAGLASGDANAAMGDILGADAVGEGSDEIPGRPMHDVEIEKALEGRPELLEKFRRARALNSMEPDMKKKVRELEVTPSSKLYANGGIPGLSTSISGEEDDLNEAQKIELQAAGRGDLVQGILDESGELGPGVVESNQMVERMPSQQSDILSKYQELKKQLEEKPEPKKFEGPSFGAALTDSLQTLSNIVNRDVQDKSDRFNPNASIKEKQEFEKKQAAEAARDYRDYNQKLNLFKLHNTLSDQQKAEQYKQDKFTFEKDKFAADQEYKQKQAKIEEMYRQGMLDKSTARLELDKLKFEHEKKKTPEDSLKIFKKKEDYKEELRKARKDFDTKGKKLGFEEKERKKAEIRDEFKQKEESRVAKKEREEEIAKLKENIGTIDNKLADVKDALGLLTKISKGAGSVGTGPADQFLAKIFGGKLNPKDQNPALLRQKLNAFALEEMKNIFAGMSKAIDSDAERRFFMQSLPSMSEYETDNIDILNDMQEKLEGLRSKAQKAIQADSKDGSEQPQESAKRERYSPNEVERKIKGGRIGIFDSTTKKFIRYKE
jgi:GH24 family phage-related lysozyme (muramidase)